MSEQNAQDFTSDVNFECKFCKIILYGGFDNNDLMHCQWCHNIWDGNAQCHCWILSFEDDVNMENESIPQ
jgi:hypothetical protein